MSARNPKAVVGAFAPQGEALRLTLGGWILLEAVNSPFLLGGTPTTRDTLILWLAMTRREDMAQALAAGGEAFDNWIMAHAEAMTPAEFGALRPQLTAALAAAVRPLAETAADDSGAGKKKARSAGGSPSSTASPTNTAGRKKK